jgi:hypothetical protein
MDFIERLFGISPDGGDGTTEMLWLIAFASTVVMAIALGTLRLRRRRRR